MMSDYMTATLSITTKFAQKVLQPTDYSGQLDSVLTFIEIFRLQITPWWPVMC